MTSTESDHVTPESHGGPAGSPPQGKAIAARRRTRFVAKAIIVVALGWIGFKIYLVTHPLVTPGPDMLQSKAFDGSTRVGRAVAGVAACAERQKGLFGYIEAYRQKNGHVPQSIDALLSDNLNCMHFTRCPENSNYTINPGAYGNRNAALISEEHDHHPTAFALWIRGIHPRVRTMGDGTIRMFEGSALQMSMSAKP
jgi:hypothetical protein